MAVSIKKDYWDPEILKSSEESPCQQSLQCIFYVVKFRVEKKESQKRDFELSNIFVEHALHVAWIQFSTQVK